MSQTELYRSATSSPQDTPASHSASPKGLDDEGQPMLATYGRTYERSLPRAGRLGLFARMFSGMFVWASTMYLMNWRDWATPRGRLLSRLAVSTRRTSARDSGSCHAERQAWPTPLASDSKRSGHHAMDTNGGSPALARQVVLRERFPTPKASNAMGASVSTQRQGAEGVKDDGNGIRRQPTELPRLAGGLPRDPAPQSGVGGVVDGLPRWLDEPPIPRLTEKYSGRTDQIRGLGNAIVPQLARRIGEAIKLVEETQ